MADTSMKKKAVRLLLSATADLLQAVIDMLNASFFPVERKKPLYYMGKICKCDKCGWEHVPLKETVRYRPVPAGRVRDCKCKHCGLWHWPKR